jgi:hypothetical protein
MAAQPNLAAPPENLYLGKALNALLDGANTLKGEFGDSFIAIESDFHWHAHGRAPSSLCMVIACVGHCS